MPRRRPPPVDLRAPREALARLVMAHVGIEGEQARGPVSVAHDGPRTVVLSWRSTARTTTGRIARSTVHQRTVFEAASLVINRTDIRTQAGKHVGIVNAGPTYQQAMLDLREALATQLYEQRVLREVLMDTRETAPSAKTGEPASQAPPGRSRARL